MFITFCLVCYAGNMEMPEDVAQALQAAGLLEQFTALPPSHQREYLKWITEAKRPETRAQRIAKTCTMLAAKSGG